MGFSRQEYWSGLLLPFLRPSRTNTKKTKDGLFIIGDWNAKVESQEIPGVTDKFGLGVQNEAGQKLTFLHDDLYRQSLLWLQATIPFIIGDWNAKVESQEIPGVTGKFGLECGMKQGKD